MTDKAAIVNRALQVIGTRTTVTASELTNQTSNEAIQANLLYDNVRDELLRMAPWDCARKMGPLTYITSLPGTPENTSAATTTWARGQPAPPWVYEYQYPVDCLKALWIVPQIQSSISGVPIFPVATGIVPAFSGPSPKFSVGIDQFRPVTAVAIAAGGTGHAVNDIITLPSAAAGVAPIGAPAQIKVLTVNGSGVILTAELVNVIIGSSSAIGGSYFSVQTNPIAQSSTTGSGTGATFNLTFGALSDQRVILCNEQSALLSYVRQVTDPNVMDALFIKAWVHVLGAGLTMALTGDKGRSNNAIEVANFAIEQARTADANEGLTVNDFTPDWIRTRGVIYPGPSSIVGPYVDWGGLWPSYT